MKYIIPTVGIFASLLSSALALKNNEVYTIESPSSGDVWGIQRSIGVEHRVQLTHPEGKEVEQWRFISSGSDFFVQNVYTQGMLGCPAPMNHQCEVDTLGNDAQLFSVTENPDRTFTFRPSGSSLVLGTGEGSEVKAQPSGPSVDAAFRLRLIESNYRGWM